MRRWLLSVLMLTMALCALADTPPAVIAMSNSTDGAEMVWVPAGTFSMGVSDDEILTMLQGRTDYQADWFAPERPQHEVQLSGYWVYKYEVTVAQYRRFCQATKRAMPELPAFSKDDHPMVNVTWDDADAYVTWAAVQLPTEAQWEKAARGTDKRFFPWGNTWDGELCNNYSDHAPAGGGFQGLQTSPVGSYPASVSPYGADDMAGNVWEWCRDWYDENYYKQSPKENPTGPETGEERVMRGGSWGSTSRSTRVTVRASGSPDLSDHDSGGFRCVVEPQAAITDLHVVALQLMYDAQGKVTKNKLIKSCGSDGDDNAAVKAAMKLRIQPGKDKDVPVAGEISVTVYVATGGKVAAMEPEI